MKIAIYAGTFDPMTSGHVDIALRAARLFDRLIIGVAKENYKSNMFSLEERCRLAEEALVGNENISVMPFDGLLVDFCRDQGASVIIRGLRAAADFDVESQMALLNRNLNGGVETVFLMSDAKYQFISSTLIRNCARLGADMADMVPPCVARALAEKNK